MTPTWYDVLGVEPDASEETIRAAWKAGIADLDPGDRRFRTCNEAAEVLLDPTRRAAYDAALEPETLPEPVVVREETPASSPDPAVVEGPFGATALPSSTGVDQQAALPTPPPPTTPLRAPGSGTARRSVPAVVLAVLAVLTLLMAAIAAYLVTQPSDKAVADATSDAQGAAERAAVAILAYDYRTLDEDQETAGRLMTSDYRKDYDKLFEVIKGNAADVKPVVTVDVVASGIVRSGEDRVQVLVFVNRPTTNAATTEPKVYRDQVRMTMVRSGDDWLVDDMQTGPTAT